MSERAAQQKITEKPECELGYTDEQVRRIVGDRIEEFWKWMAGQTGSICDGRRYDHDKREYEVTGCGPHGPVTYGHDLAQFLRGGRPLD